MIRGLSKNHDAGEHGGKSFQSDSGDREQVVPTDSGSAGGPGAGGFPGAGAQGGAQGGAQRPKIDEVD